jgi:hypothetical protein
MARSTSSAGISNAEPAISCGLPSFHSSRTAFSARSLPFSPTNSFVATDQSRLAPSSCEDEVRRRVGQYGQTGLRSTSGGMGKSSNCVTDFAPWRFEVPTQSEPVSPPPMMTTFLPLAQRSAMPRSPATRLFWSGRNSIAKWTPSSSRPGIGRSRGCSAPPASTTASNSASSFCGVMLRSASFTTPLPGRCVPTNVLVLN